MVSSKVLRVDLDFRATLVRGMADLLASGGNTTMLDRDLSFPESCASGQ